MVTKPPFDHEPGLLVGTECAAVGRNRLEMDAVQVEAPEPELDEMEDCGCTHPATARFWYQGDPGLGVPGERVEAKERRAADGCPVDIDDESSRLLRRVASEAGVERRLQDGEVVVGTGSQRDGWHLGHEHMLIGTRSTEESGS
jgi:hypothetical protein